MKKSRIIKYIFPLIIVTGIVACNNEGTSSSLNGNRYADYIENAYCRTIVNDIADSDKYVNVGNMKQIRTALKNNDGTFEDGDNVDAFDTNLIFSRYATKDLLTGRDIMDIEEIIGPYTYKTHRLFDRHNYYFNEKKDGIINNLRIINENYGGDFIEIDEELYNVLQDALNITIESKGKFNIFVGELSDFWNKYINSINIGKNPEDTVDPAQTNEGKLMVEQLLLNTPQYEDAEKCLELKKENNKFFVRFNKFMNKEGMYADKVSLSLGGIGKGYLTENLYQQFKKANKTNGNVYAGSSSIVLMGPSAYSNPWRIQISNPINYYATPLGIVSLNDKYSISTSGSQVNSYTTLVDGKYVNRQHIIDATSGYPSDNYSMVTIFSKKLSSTLMDTLSTILINCDENEIKETIEYFRTKYNADLDFILSKKSLYTGSNSDYTVDVYLSKNMSDPQVFEKTEELGDGGIYSPYINYHSLDY